MATLEYEIEPLVHPRYPNAPVDATDIDGMALMLQMVTDEIGKLAALKNNLRLAMWNLTQGTARTRRLVTDRFKLKLEQPPDSWQQSTLKELWKDDPDQSKTYLRVATLAPNLREVKKMEQASGNERFTQYRDKLLGARQRSGSPPTVTFEKVD